MTGSTGQARRVESRVSASRRATEWAAERGRIVRLIVAVLAGSLALAGGDGEVTPVEVQAGTYWVRATRNGRQIGEDGIVGDSDVIVEVPLERTTD